MPVVSIHSVAELDAQLRAAGNRLVIVDFVSSSCDPCKNIAPHFAALSNTHAAHAIFLKVDIGASRDVAQAFDVSVVPTFVFFRNGKVIESVQSSDRTILEAKITEYFGQAGAGEPTQKHGDLSPFISKQLSECLNENDEHCLTKLLDGSGYIESDNDEQLLINIGFTQPVKLYSLRLAGPKNAPKSVRIFINQPNTLDFDSASSMKPVQTLALEGSDTDIEHEAQIELKYVKFQSVSNIQLFIGDNQDGSDVTRIDKLQLFGTPLCSTNMNDFKRVSGHKGEVH